MPITILSEIELLSILKFIFLHYLHRFPPPKKVENMIFTIIVMFFTLMPRRRSDQIIRVTERKSNFGVKRDEVRNVH